jgi:flagellar motor switch protein FliN/FliY
MGDGSLSQEEIDALLQGADDLGGAMDMDEALAGIGDAELNELRNLSSDVAQSMGLTLSTITGKPVTIESVTVDLMTRDNFASDLEGRVVQVAADYSGGAPGQHSYILSENPARQIAALMMAQEEGDLTEMALSALTEGFSQMSGASLTAISDRSGLTMKSEEVRASLFESADDVTLPEGSFVRIRYKVQTDGKASILDELLEERAALALSGGGGAGAAMPQGTPQQAAAAGGFQPGIQQQDIFGAPAGGGVGVQPVQFAPLSHTEQPGLTGNIGLLMDVSMQLTVELGRTKMLIKDILGMGEGTIVELDKLAGEPVDLLVNGKLIAKGEVVVIDENFGVRVTDIISPMERISSLE